MMCAVFVRLSTDQSNADDSLLGSNLHDNGDLVLFQHGPTATPPEIQHVVDLIDRPTSSDLPYLNNIIDIEHQ